LRVGEVVWWGLEIDERYLVLSRNNMKKLPAVLGSFGPRRPDFQHYSLENSLQVVMGLITN
jgi:hypothetical protein